MSAVMPGQDEFHIEMVDDGTEAPTPVDEGMEFDLAELMGEPRVKAETAKEKAFYRNLAEDMEESALTSLAGDLIGDFEGDVASRKDWLQTYVDGLELLGFKMEKRTEPWSGACGVFHPILSEALVKFQAEAIMAIFPAMGPVKTKVLGKETPQKVQAAKNVQEDMNFQLTEVMTEYRPEHERLLWGLGLSGNAFKKVYFDPGLNRQAAFYVPAEDLVVPYGASSLDSAERVTHVMRKTQNEVRKLQAAGFYCDIKLADPARNGQYLDEVEKKIAENMGFSATSDDRYRLLEMHVDLDLEEYGVTDGEADNEENESGPIARPYVVTIEKSTQTVLAIYRNWVAEDDLKKKREHFVHYYYIPGFGFYAYGLVHLLGSFAKSGTSLIRQLVDAGTLSNLPGGFKSRGMRVKGDDTPISPGEFRDVDVASGTIKDNIMTLPYKEPSQVLMTLLQNIIAEGKEFASIANINVSDMSAQAPVGTTLAILERTLKVISSVHSRIHYSMKREFKLLAAIIRDFTPDKYAYEPLEGDRKAKKTDYDMVEVIPVSDPNASTMAQKVTQYQAVIQLASGTPGIYDMPELHKNMLEVLGIKNIDKIIPTAEDAVPMDPVSENMAILIGKPVKAFLYQDHKSHIAAHMAAAQDPHITQLMQQNPQAPAIMAAGAAHIAEHAAFQYRKEIERQLGFELPPQNQKLPPEAEFKLSQLVAQAAAQVQQQNTAQAQQQAAQAQAKQDAQDPLTIIQKQELALKGQELQHKMQIAEQQMNLEQAKLAVEMKKIGSQVQLKDKEITGRQMIDAAKFQAGASGKEIDQRMQQQAASQEQLKEGLKMGMDNMHKHMDREHQEKMEGIKQAGDMHKQMLDKFAEPIAMMATSVEKQPE